MGLTHSEELPEYLLVGWDVGNQAQPRQKQAVSGLGDGSCHLLSM